ncbi:hypothetical protein [Lederbergia lenta]|uniref:hypothetical protein n=1 Tax=Lederbergia lenta TaxID=1467 RepID=UPI0020411E20|nr:hypothetical protein [Lederbergia lenta]MCM3109929.1 hypothetical protein [Lederbergia lenta]
MNIEEMINRLQEIKDKHGNLDIYECDDAFIYKHDGKYRPRTVKLYHQKWEDDEPMRDELSDGNLEEDDCDLYDVDLGRPIFKAVLI